MPLLVGELASGVLIVAAVLLVVLGARLASGSLAIAFLLPRLEAAFSAAGEASVVIGAASVAWAGFREGPGHPLRLTLRHISVQSRDPVARALIPRARAALSVEALLRGRILARGIAIEAPEVTITREREGQARAGGRRGEKAGSAGEPARPSRGPALSSPFPPSSFARRLHALRDLEIDRLRVTVIDPALGRGWHAPEATIALERDREGALRGTLSLASLSDRSPARLLASVRLENRRLRMSADLSPHVVAALAAAWPRLAPATALDAPADIRLDVAWDGAFREKRWSLAANVRAGALTLGGARIPVRSARLVAEGSDGEVRLRRILVHLGAKGAGEGPTLAGSALGLRGADGAWRGRASFSLARVPMAELARYWPPDVAPGGRAWVTENITGGIAHDGHVALAFHTAPGGEGFVLGSVSGAVSGDDLVVHWLRPLPPLTNGKAELTIRDPNALRIRVDRAREGRLAVRRGEVIITGLARPDQDATISAAVEGPLGSALALLAHPRLNLLARQKLPLEGASGTAAVDLTISLPLLKHVSFGAIRVRAQAGVRALSVPRLIGRYGLERGTLSLHATNDALRLAGDGFIAGLRTHLTASMDFRAGPPMAITERLNAATEMPRGTLARLGFGDVARFVRGPIGLGADLEWRRDGRAEARIHADLAHTSLDLGALGLTEAAGRGAAATATLALSGDEISRIDHFAIRGRAIAVDGSVAFAGGKPTRLIVTRAVLGRSEAAGSVRFGRERSPPAIMISGPQLDLSGLFTRARTGRGEPEEPRRATKVGSGWRLEAHFARVLLARSQELLGVSVAARSNGRYIAQADATGDFPDRAPISVAITPGAQGRILHLATANAGDLAAGVGLTGMLQGGALSLSGRYDDRAEAPVLSGHVEVRNLRVRNAPAAVHILEALTLYGLVQAVRGPGLSISEFITGFRWQRNRLELTDARAFNPSIGATASGSIDLSRGLATLSGTIVPMYFFNSLLGRIPVIGKAFSPEKGGGLFAATYRVTGPLDNLTIRVDPLAALAPGFLRGFFSLFGG